MKMIIINVFLRWIIIHIFLLLADFSSVTTVLSISMQAILGKQITMSKTIIFKLFLIFAYYCLQLNSKLFLLFTDKPFN